MMNGRILDHKEERPSQRALPVIVSFMPTGKVRWEIPARYSPRRRSFPAEFATAAYSVKPKSAPIRRFCTMLCMSRVYFWNRLFRVEVRQKNLSTNGDGFNTVVAPIASHKQIQRKAL
jgi:hypothetical protein